MVEALAAFGLPLDVVMGVPSCVCDGSWPMTFHKCRCHMVKGLFRSISLDRFSPKITALHRMHKSTAEANFYLCFYPFQIGVVVFVDPVEESQPTIQAAISILMDCFGNPFLPGHFCASCVIQ